jgi:hypothetical protein
MTQTVTQTVWLRGEYQRRLAHQLIDKAPQDAVVKISAAKRSDDQNAKCGPCFQTLVGQHQRIGITYQKFGSAYLWQHWGMK